MASKTKIKDRITAALKENGGRMPYWKLADAVFPTDQYPRAWERPTRGGPPGCYMVLSRAIREHGFSMHFGDAKAVVHTVIGLGKNL
jgi:hypothetical protein